MGVQIEDAFTHNIDWFDATTETAFVDNLGNFTDAADTTLEEDFVLTAASGSYTITGTAATIASGSASPAGAAVLMPAGCM